MTGHSNAVMSLVVLSDDYIVSGSVDTSTFIWNVNTGVISSYHSHTSQINALALHPNGNLITASSDSTAKLWYLNKNGFISETLNVNATVLSLTSLKDNAGFASGLSDKSIKIFSPYF